MTLNKWMRLAKKKLDFYLNHENVKGINDAYKLTGIIPEGVKEHAQETGESDKVKLAWSPIKFSTRIDDWTKDQALDWLYEYDRMSQWARTLRMEFGLT